MTNLDGIDQSFWETSFLQPGILEWVVVQDVGDHGSCMVVQVIAKLLPIVEDGPQACVQSLHVRVLRETSIVVMPC